MPWEEKRGQLIAVVESEEPWSVSRSRKNVSNVAPTVSSIFGAEQENTSSL